MIWHVGFPVREDSLMNYASCRVLYSSQNRRIVDRGRCASVRVRKTMFQRDVNWTLPVESEIRNASTSRLIENWIETREQREWGNWPSGRDENHVDSSFGIDGRRNRQLPLLLWLPSYYYSFFVLANSRTRRRHFKYSNPWVKSFRHFVTFHEVLLRADSELTSKLRVLNSGRLLVLTTYLMAILLSRTTV